MVWKYISCTWIHTLNVHILNKIWRMLIQKPNTPHCLNGAEIQMCCKLILHELNQWYRNTCVQFFYFIFNFYQMTHSIFVKLFSIFVLFWIEKISLIYVVMRKINSPQTHHKRNIQHISNLFIRFALDCQQRNIHV